MCSVLISKAVIHRSHRQLGVLKLLWFDARERRDHLLSRDGLQNNEAAAVTKYGKLIPVYHIKKSRLGLGLYV